MKYAMSYKQAERLLRQNEENLQKIYLLLPTPEHMRKQVRDQAAQTSVLSKRLTDYGKKVSGVVRAKN